MHDHHAAAALRQSEAVRVADPKVDAPAQALLLREAPARLDEARADVRGRDRPPGVRAAGDGARRHARAAAEVEDGFRPREGEAVRVLADRRDEERVLAPYLQPLGHDRERRLVHLVCSPVHVGHPQLRLVHHASLPTLVGSDAAGRTADMCGASPYAVSAADPCARRGRARSAARDHAAPCSGRGGRASLVQRA